MANELVLVSHRLCPYVQRVAIVLEEKSIPYHRRDIDLGNKPAWFLDMSPLGKTPVLSVGSVALFESAVICEYLEEAYAHPLHPAQPLERARHRSWMEFGSSMLNAVAGFYSAPDRAAMWGQQERLTRQFQRLEAELVTTPFFSGEAFSLVDAVFAPLFRYFDVFDRIADFGFFGHCPKLRAWRAALMARPSVQRAVAPEYPEWLHAFLLARGSALSGYMAQAGA